MRKFLQNHRVILLSLVLVLTAGLLTACGSSSKSSDTNDKVIKMRLAQSKADNHPVSKGYEKFAELVKEKTNGQIQVQVFNNAVLGSDRECIESAQKGTLDLAGSSTPNMASFTNKFLAWDLPYIFANKDEVYKVVDGEPGKQIEQDLEKLGFKVIFFPDYGYRQFVNNVKEVKVPADIAGLKVRTTNSPIEIADYKAFGANPTPIAWGETFTALQQGTVQGEGNSYSLLLDSKHTEVIKYTNEINYNYSSDICVMNKKIFDGLTADQQKALMAAGQEAMKWQRDLANKRDEESKQEFIKAGIKVYEPTADELKQWKTATKSVWGEFVTKGKADPEYVNLILKTLGKTQEDIFK